MSDPTTHPSPEELSAFNLGQLPPQAAAAVEDHISECESCCETLLGLGSHDTFLSLLKEAHQPGEESGNPTLLTGKFPRARESQPTVPETLTEHTRYEIVRLIGKGGMGNVFEARHRMMDRTVALKVINHEFVRKPQAVDRFHREVKAAARLSHPNIVTAYDAEQAGDLHFLVMEYVDGIDLARLVKERGPLSVTDTCEYIRQAAVGLQYAHTQGMVHRDIKPHNLMVSSDGTVKILDFGLASLAPEVLPEAESSETPGELTAAGAIIGTPDFISPEQAQDAHQADIRSDIYSLGATLYYLLSGRAPFADANVIEKLKNHAEQEPVPLENLQIEIPDELAAVMRKMMAKNSAERYQTPQEVADALDRISAQLRSSAEPALSWILDTAGTAGHSEHPQAIKSLAGLLLGAALLNLIWIAVVTVNVLCNLGGFTDSPFWETLGAPLFYCSLIEFPLAIALGFGAWQMRRLQSYHWSKTAAVLAMIPLTPVNLVFGIVCGLWALRLLKKPGVTVLFDSSSSPGSSAGTAGAEPSARLAATPAGSGWIVRRVVSLAFCSFLCVLAGVFYIQLDKTTLKFEVLDPNIEVKFGSESVVFQDRRGADTAFTVKPGTKQKFVVEQNGATVETDSLVLNRGDRVVLKIDLVEGEILIKSNDPGQVVQRVPHSGQNSVAETQKPPESEPDSANGEFATQFDQLLSAVAVAKTDADWQQLIAEHAPVLSEFPVQIARTLLQVLESLPETTHQQLLKQGYLKWRFKDLDSARQQSLKNIFGDLLAISRHPSLDRDTIAQLTSVLDSRDTGFAVLESQGFSGHILIWYALSADSPVSSLIPILGVESGSGKQIFLSVHKQLSELEDKPYSAVPPDEKLISEELQRLQGVWTFDRSAGTALQPAQMSFEIDGSNWTMKDASTGRTLWSRTVELDPSQDPKHLTLKDAKSSKPLNGIYRLEGDELHVVWPRGGQKRPTEFNTEERDAFYFIMRREPPAGQQGTGEGGMTSNYALEFEGEYAGVSLPVPYDGSHPLTLECTLRLEKSEFDRTQLLNTNKFRGPFSLNLTWTREMHLEFWWHTGGPSEPMVRSKEPFPFGETVHIAGVYTGKEIRLFVNGKLQESQPLPPNYRFPRTTRSINSITLGSLPGGDPSLEFGKSVLGLVDEIRISKVARYDRDFTPAERFETDEDTMALYHFDEDSRRTVRDSSGHQRDGKNFGAKWVKWPDPDSSERDSSQHKTDPTSLEFQWAHIPAGSFLMGTAKETVNTLPPDDAWFFAGFVPARRRAETPQHQVTITKPFEMSRHEVTVAQFRQFVKATGYKTAAEQEGYGYGWNLGEWEEGAQFDWQHPGFEISDEHPVINVSWEDADAFCKWLSSQSNRTCRLPTEAEWEYACRAGTTTLFSTGDDPDSLQGFANLADARTRKQYDHITWAVDWEDGIALTAPVGSFKPNSFGLYDMHGNAWEWCQDVYDSEWYATSPAQDPLRQGTTGIHVFRGGGFDNWPGFLRSADRYSSHSPYLRSQWAGFRVVREIDEEAAETP